jgi:hypothetical protein
MGVKNEVKQELPASKAGLARPLVACKARTPLFTSFYNFRNLNKQRSL